MSLQYVNGTATVFFREIIGIPIRRTIPISDLGFSAQLSAGEPGFFLTCIFQYHLQIQNTDDSIPHRPSGRSFNMHMNRMGDMTAPCAVPFSTQCTLIGRFQHAPGSSDRTRILYVTVAWAFATTSGTVDRILLKQES